MRDDDQDNPPDVLTVTEAAAWLRVRPESVRRALAAGHLPGGKVGGQWRLSRRALEEFLQGGGQLDDSDDPPRRT